jgi:glucosamine--fructose-6-phosphate aminotransferase (isomerizing)
MTTDILDDILDQPRMLAAALQNHLQPGSTLDTVVQGILQMRPRRMILTGMGSSLFAAYPAYLRLLGSGLAAIWIELSELLHYAGGQIGPDTLLVIISQSGETVEALRLLADCRPAGSVLAITNNAESTLAKQSRWVITTGAGPELTVATKTYSAALLALTLLAERIVGTTPRELAAMLAPAITAASSVAATAQEQIEQLAPEWFIAGPITLVGRGPALATALSGGLLLKETAKVPAEGMSSAQFRHGPLEISGPGHRAIVCAAPGPTLALDQKLALELQAHGSRVLLIGSPAANANIETIPLPETGYTNLYALIPLQLLARELAIRQGIAPGAFRFIGKVTTDE